MLSLEIRGSELFDDSTGIFSEIKGRTIVLEHSLISISNWEMRHHKAFFSEEKKTIDETIDYVRCMTITPNVDQRLYLCLTKQNLDDVYAYLSDSMTATTFAKANGSRHSPRKITSELIYYWMIAYGIPFECQKWNINRLFTLIHICALKNAPAKKMSLRDRNAINNERRSRLKTRG